MTTTKAAAIVHEALPQERENLQTHFENALQLFEPGFLIERQLPET